MKRTGNRIALGLDFGTESVRAVLVILCGCEVGDAVAGYRHGQITRELIGTGELLPSDFALQHPNDWSESSSRAVKRAVRAAAARSMAAVESPRIVRPCRGRHKVYDRLYQRYRDLTSHIANG